MDGVGQNVERDGSLAVLEYVDRLLVRHPLQRSPVHRQDLVTALQPAVVGRRPSLEHRLHVDGHVAVRGPEPANDGESEALVAATELHCLRDAGGGDWDGRLRARAGRVAAGVARVSRVGLLLAPVAHSEATDLKRSKIYGNLSSLPQS